MKTLALLGLVVALLVATAVASPVVAAGLAALGWDLRFSRVYNRVFEVLLVVAIVGTWRRLDLGRPGDWGLRREGWRRDIGVGVTAGVIGIGVGLAMAWIGGGLVPGLRYGAAKTVWKGALGLAGAFIVGVGEEVLFRGILVRRFVLDLGVRGGMLLVTVVYAVVHALRNPSGRVDLGWWAGWQRTATLFAPLADRDVLPSVVGLFGLGLLLVMIRRHTGTVWVGVGIHAAWVGVFRVGRLLFDIRGEPAWLVGPGWPPLIGGAAGLGALAITTLVAAGLLRRREALQAARADGVSP